MNPGAPKDAVDQVQTPKAEAAVFNAPDLQTGGNRDNLAAKSDALVTQGIVPAVEFTGDSTARLIKTQSVDQATLDAERKGTAKGSELAVANPADAAPAPKDGGQPKAVDTAQTAPDKVNPQPGDQPQAKANPQDAPADKTPTGRPTDAPADKAPTGRPTDVPVDKTPTVRPTDAPADKTPNSVPADATPEKPPANPGDQPAPKPAEVPPASPTDGQATNPQFLENAKVRRGEGPYQVASRLLAADGQPTKQADVKALTEAFKKVYGDQQKADPNLPGLAGLKQNHAFINKDNLKAVTDELKKSGHPELADRLTKDATAKPPGDATPAKPGDVTPAKPSDAPQAKPGDQPQKRQYSSQEIAGEALGKISEIPKDQPVDKAVESLGNVLGQALKRPELFQPGTNRDTITDQLNKNADKSEDPRIKGKEFYWDPNNKLRLRDKPKPAATRPTAAPITELSA